MNKFKDKFKQLEDMQKSLVEEALVYLKDKNEPLEDRWAVYCGISGYLPMQSWYMDIPTVDSYYDDLHCDRHQTVYLADLPDILQNRTEEQINEIMEWAMASGYGS